MGRKKREKSIDAAKDFFGDGDIDWLDDEDDRLPVAPPPPPVAKTARPVEAKPAGEDWAKRVSEVPSDTKALSSAPTLIFSSVPTLPPIPAPALERTDARPHVDQGPAALTERARVEPPVTEEVETVEVARVTPAADLGDIGEPPTAPTEMIPVPVSDAEIVLPPLPIQASVTEESAVEGDALDAQRAEAKPNGGANRGSNGFTGTRFDQSFDVVPPEDESAPESPDDTGPLRIAVPLSAAPGPTLRRATKAPAAERVGLPSARRAPSEPPVVAPQAPREGVEAWKETVQTLESESVEAVGNGRALLLAEAGRVTLRVLGDAGAAETFLSRANMAGAIGADALRNLAEIRGVLGWFDDQEQALVRLAQVAEGVDAGEAWLEAALVAWRRLDRSKEAVAYLRKTAEALPDDYTARALLRSLLPTVDPDAVDERLELLASLAGLAEGGIAADAWVELATVAAEHEAHRARVRPALEAALAAEPGHVWAFHRLEQELQSDPAALANLYDRESGRDPQSDAGWWTLKSARAWQAAGDLNTAALGFSLAADAGYAFALRELEGGYARVGAAPELESALAREADATSVEDGRAFALFRLGWLRENQLADPVGALAAYREAVKADPLAWPAADAVGRLIDAADRRAFWEQRLAAVPTAAERRSVRLRLAELAEADDDQVRARGLFQAVLDEDGGGAEAEVARDGLERVLQRLASDPDQRAALAELRKRRADTAWDMGEKVGWLLLAATQPASEDEALPLLGLALDARPDHPVAVAAISLPLERKGAWRELANRLRAAGDASEDPVRRAACLYRAARVFSERAGDDVAARACIDQAIGAEPKLMPARWLARQLRVQQRDAAAEAAACREQAALAGDPRDPGDSAARVRAWSLFAAAVADGVGPAARADLETVLAEHPAHPGAMAALEVLLVAEEDRTALIGLYRRTVDQAEGVTAARLAARTAELLADAGQGTEAALVLRRLQGVPGAPLRAAARLALSMGAPDRAIELLSGSTSDEDRVERARLLTSVERSEEALPELMQLMERLDDKVGVAARAATVAQAVGDAEAMVRAYATIAENARSSSLRVAYSAWTAMQLQAGGRDDLALHQWRMTLAERPSSTAALTGALRGLIARRDADGLAKLFAIFRPESPSLLAEALVQAGDPAGAAEVLTALADELATSGATPEAQIPTLLWIERLRGEQGQWQAAYDALARRRELCRSPQVREAADVARRWILSEKLVGSDAAWELYRRLHEDTPEDRQVTEALARIASARNEVSVAIGYLHELADGAPSAIEAARYRRRIGEVYETSGQSDAARQAYLDALDHVPDDREALDGLRRIAEQSKDWQGLVAVLQRESGSPDRARQIAVRREIARVDEDKIGDRAVAMDAWRSLLEVEPTDREALEHLSKLAKGLGEWGVFVETGEALAAQLAGADKAALLREVGIACADRLGRDDATRYFEEAVAITPPDYEAAQRLESIARSRADWPATVRALSLQADSAADPNRRLDALLRAARIEVEALHDKDAAAGLYTRILELRADHELALRFMVAHLFETGRFDEALPLCERLEPVVEKDQDLDDFDTRMELAGFFFYFAELLRLAGDEETSLTRYERTLELNPTHLPSLEAVGPLYTSLEKWDKAERVYRQLLQLSGGQGDRQKVASTYTALGLVERRLGFAEKAYKRFTKALELHPNHVGALKGMALVLEDRQDWSNLLNVYNNIIYHATVPEDVIDAYMTKGRILDDQMQRQDKAAQHYQRSLDFDPNQPNAYLRLAELAMRRDAYKDAEGFAEKALTLDDELVAPYRARLKLVRAAAWQHAGRSTDAERSLREARNLDNDLVAGLGDVPLHDLERVRQLLKERLPL